MGEKIRDIGKTHIGKADLVIELNKATSSNGPRFIHIQNEHFRYCLTESDYYQFCADLIKAKKHLLWTKGIEEDE